jgi:predicted nucleotidyltransferase
METNRSFNDLVKGFSELDEVDAILLGGSRAGHRHDELSDFDLYIYTSREISLEKRKEITDRYCGYMELNNQFWETEDDGILVENTIPIDIIYRGLDWVEESLHRVLFRFEASLGYTTALWFNFINSNILYDASGRAERMKEKYSIMYPQQLKKAIIAKNLPLLRDQLPAYLFQIEKAIKRRDIISINHRLSEFFASYFDIVFAINELAHPGEKRILEYLSEKGEFIPENMSDDVEGIIKKAIVGDFSFTKRIHNLVDRLEVLINYEK